MGNQCNSPNNGVQWEKRGELQINLAHAFCILFVVCLTDCQVNRRINCYNNLIYLWQMHEWSFQRFPESNVFEYVLYWINDKINFFTNIRYVGPFWFSTEQLCTTITPFLLSTYNICNSTGILYKRCIIYTVTVWIYIFSIVICTCTNVCLQRSVLVILRTRIVIHWCVQGLWFSVIIKYRPMLNYTCMCVHFELHLEWIEYIV